ncbi:MULTISPECIES: hypothetical protein [Butyricimonas]|uniref:hypothetical protein n=1 Tax=Butyricimonas TaxID=574697 RepID=UPI001D07C5DE|nr:MULTISPECIES: hypothetical protein [Butyricimonas]MCB6972455.1 hypothetical protein [Butyricimonas synergistica]MCG4519463.1 hypothetical protein [Butyricimonas sp. DFI.6.44]
MRDAALKDFVLVGGVDLDLFSDVSFDEGELSGYLISEYNLELDFIAKCTL